MAATAKAAERVQLSLPSDLELRVAAVLPDALPACESLVCAEQVRCETRIWCQVFGFPVIVTATSSSGIEWDQLMAEHRRFFALATETAAKVRNAGRSSRCRSSKHQALLVEVQGSGGDHFGTGSLCKGYHVLVPQPADGGESDASLSFVMKALATQDLIVPPPVKPSPFKAAELQEDRGKIAAALSTVCQNGGGVCQCHVRRCLRCPRSRRSSSPAASWSPSSFTWPPAAQRSSARSSRLCMRAAATRMKTKQSQRRARCGH